MQLLAPVPDVSIITVWTRSEGLLARAGHDLALLATTWRGSASITGRRFSAEVAVPARGLRAQGAAEQGRIVALGEREHRDIDATLTGPHVLDAARHAEVRWSGGGTLPDGGVGEVTAEGQLTLRGTTRALPLVAQVQEQDGAVVVSGDVTLRQSAFGLKPYSAFLGTLRVRDEVKVSWRVVFKRLAAGGSS